jgi:hypothetical protein
MRPWRTLAAIGLTGMGCALVGAVPAASEIDGACQASGSFEEGTEADGPFTVDAADVGADEVVVVPLADTVDWEASVEGDGSERDISGFVAVDLPPPFGSWTIDSWDSTSSTYENSGSEEYDLPSAMPRGVEFRVYGEHREDGEVVCSGEVWAEVEGDPFDTPLTPVSLGLTVAAGAGFVLAGRPRFGRL